MGYNKEDSIYILRLLRESIDEHRDHLWNIEEDLVSGTKTMAALSLGQLKECLSEQGDTPDEIVDALDKKGVNVEELSTLVAGPLYVLTPANNNGAVWLKTRLL